MFGITLALIAVLLGTASAMAADFYVSTTGSDSNPGTQIAPFLTLQKGASVATPGTTIHVAPGTYSALTYCYVPSLVAGYSAVCMMTSGTPTAPITFVSDTKWGAKLVCPSDSGFFALVASYIVISGFDMSCPGSSSPYGWAVVTYGNNNGHNTFYNNYLHDFSVNGCPSTGILTSGNAGYNVFNANIIRHVGSSTPGRPQCNQIHGVYMSAPYDVAINNIISGVIGFGISDYGGGVCNQIIANNTVFDNSQGGIAAENVGGQLGYPDYCNNGGSTDYITITNNISINNGYGNGYNGAWSGIAVYGAHMGTNNNVSNNLVYGNNTNSAGNVSRRTTNQVITYAPTLAVNTITGTNASVFTNYRSDKNWMPDPLYAAGNYQLLSTSTNTSPAINAGTSDYTSCADFNGVSRPQLRSYGLGYDIGAYEYVSPAPSVSTNLKGNPVSSSKINLTWPASKGK
jgi:Protein of unknown function (DUF1565)